MKAPKPKIAMIIGSLLRYGGTEKHFLQLLEGLNQDFNFTIFHLNPERGKAYELLSDKAPIFNLNFSGSFVGVISSMYKAFSNLREQQPNLIYSSSLIGLILILPFSLIYRVPIISARRSLFSKAVFTWSKYFKNLIFWINNLTSKKIIGNSQAVGKQTLSYAFSREKYLTINNGLRIEQFSKVDRQGIEDFRKEFQLKEDDFIVGTIGNYRKVKNHKQIIKAAKLVLAKNKKIKFIFLGEGMERGNMEKMISTYGLEGNVILAGYRSDLVEALSVIDIFVMTSTSEGSPNALIEAFAMKKITIGSDVPSINEIIDHGKNGFLVKLNDSSGLADQVLKVYEGFSQMEKIKENSFRTAIDNFDLDKNLKAFKEVFSQVINENKRR